MGEGSTAISGRDSCDALLHTLVLCGIQETMVGEESWGCRIFWITKKNWMEANLMHEQIRVC